MDEISYLKKRISDLEIATEVILEQNKKLRQQIQYFRCKTTYRVYEENLKLAEELALIKGEMSG
jgi:hypothetical protein